MMKFYIYGFIFFIGSIAYSQVGIGTVNPQEELHIAGTGSTIRITSLNATNNPTYNDGINLTPAYVDGMGDLAIGNGTGAGGTEPLNFLIEVPNFIPDDPYTLGVNTGVAVNSAIGQTYMEGEITTVSIDVPNDAMIEIKYGITIIIVGNDLAAGPPYFYATYDEAVNMATYLKVDLYSDGLDAAESAKSYGQKGQYYETNYGGSAGYPYMNGQAYLKVPAGTHTLYFYGTVDGASTSYTSIGFGGAQDYLKIRVYN